MRVFLNQKILITLFVLATVLMFGVVRAEEAGFASSVDGGVLTVTNDQNGDVFINCSGGQVKVNGKDPQTGVASCASITTIIVNGGSDADNINLSGVTGVDFSNLSSVTVNGNFGNDVITASGVDDTLIGGPGDDVFVGTQASDSVDSGFGNDLFVEVPEPSIAPYIILDDPAVISEPQIPFAPGLGTSIEGINFNEDAALNGFYHIPPDPIGASGPNHVVAVNNTSIEWYSKAGVTESSQGLQAFFTAAGTAPVNNTFDPKVIYDQYENRFVVVTLERQDTTSGDPVNSSRILVAVSDDSNPNGTWYSTSINSMITIGVPRWADYPGFAVDDKVVYITNNMFGFGGGGFGGVRLWIIDKGVSGGFYGGGSAGVTVHDPYAGGGIATTTQPAHMFGQLPTNMGTFLVSHSGLAFGSGVEIVQSVRVDNPLSATPTFTQQYISVNDIDNQGTQPNAPQIGSTGGTTEIWTNDRRALHSVWRDNFLWVSATIVPNSGANLGQATAHWFKLDTSNLALLSLSDQGNAGGEDIHPNGDVHTFFPSIAVDPCGNMAIGFSASSADIYAGAYYTGRLASDPAGTVQTTGTLAAGTDYYYRLFGGSRNRWGDYSGISLDPSDDATFWVYNEYALTRGTVFPSLPTEDGRWGTRFGSFQFHTNGFDFGDLPIEL